MESRLGSSLEGQRAPASSAPIQAARPSFTTGVTTASVPETPAEDAVASPVEDEGAPTWPDETAESSFLAEARERGEAVSAPKSKVEASEESETGPLPPLNELVNRIPADVREVLDDLFRARFVTVKRMPKRALKS